MNILVLGDVFGPAGVQAIKERLPKIIKDKFPSQNPPSIFCERVVNCLWWYEKKTIK